MNKNKQLQTDTERWKSSLEATIKKASIVEEEREGVLVLLRLVKNEERHEKRGNVCREKEIEPDKALPAMLIAPEKESNE